jgi:uncharacterized membrane protein YoaK (UPF0700 family)
MLKNRLMAYISVPILFLNMSLGFIAGFVDALGFIALFGLFTAHITGNFVLLGAEAVTPDHTFPLLKLLAFPAFITGVTFTKLLVSALITLKRRALLLIYSIELLLLIAFMCLGIAAQPMDEPMSNLVFAAGIIGSMAMGVHSACGRLLLPDLTPTVMMTGNVTQLVVDVVDVLQGKANELVRKRCGKYFWPIMAFGLGTFVAAFGYIKFGFLALCFPIGILVLLISFELCKNIRRNVAMRRTEK